MRETGKGIPEVKRGEVACAASMTRGSTWLTEWIGGGDEGLIPRVQKVRDGGNLGKADVPKDLNRSSGQLTSPCNTSRMEIHESALVMPVNVPGDRELRMYSMRRICASSPKLN